MDEPVHAPYLFGWHILFRVKPSDLSRNLRIEGRGIEARDRPHARNPLNGCPPGSLHVVAEGRYSSHARNHHPALFFAHAISILHRSWVRLDVILAQL